MSTEMKCFNDNVIEIDGEKIELIRPSNFEELSKAYSILEKLNDYLEFSKYNFSIQDTMYVVNNDFYNKNIEYNEEIIALMKEKYYINDNLDRYI